MKQYYRQFYSNTLNNLDKMGEKILKDKLSKVTPKDIDNQNKPMAITTN